MSGLDLVTLMVDGVHFGEHCCMVALGIDIDGTKHPLSLVEGSTENATLVRELLVGLRERGLLQQLPGIGHINLAQILAEIGPILDRVDNAEHAAAECGATPVTKASGKTSGVYFRWAANTRARKAITAFAHNSRRQSRWAQRLYRDARTRGKPNPHTTRIVARSWIRVIWTCWHTNTPYNPLKHTAEQRAVSFPP